MLKKTLNSNFICEIIACRMQPSPKINFNKNKFYNYALEGLRGLAAFWVGYAHIFNFTNLLDPSFHPSNKYITDLHASHAAVLIFFILSGYVIGLTNTEKCNKSRIINYLIRRTIRLVPIYFIAIIFSILASPYDSLEVILGNLLFLQPLAVPVLSGNPILWTLNYEVVYYLLFILIWYYRPKSIYLFLGSLMIAILGWISPTFPQLLSAYASGWIFWLFGLMLAWRKPLHNSKHKIPLLSYFLILAATNHFYSGKILLNGIGLVNPNALIINLSDLALLPICLLIIFSITGHIENNKLLQIVSLSIPITTTILLISMGRLLSNPNWIISSIYTVLSLLLWFFKTNPNFLAKLSYFGSISYGFYVLHMPMMYFIHNYFPLSGSLLSFTMRAITWFFITTSICIVLELVMQPKIKHWSKQKLLTPISS